MSISKSLRKSATLILALCAVAVFGCIFVAATPASAATRDIACEGLGEALGEEGCTEGSGGDEVQSIIVTVIDILSLVVAVISVIMIIIGGFRFVASGGDPGATKSGRDTVIYALVGLVIVALAQTLVKFVVNRITSDE